jgi:UDP-N-acetylglucosamine 2-epimerase (non-hydrolysing)
MIDNLFYQLEHLDQNRVSPDVVELKSRLPGKYLCLTLHRPSNVDDSQILTSLFQALAQIAEDIPIVFPCHPRTRHKLGEFDLLKYCQQPDHAESLSKGLILLDPLPYDDFLYLWKDALAVFTDSGGLQEETTALNIPCLTLRKNTERPITVEEGSNILVGQDPNILKAATAKLLKGQGQKGKIPELWDGRASERIVQFLAELKTPAAVY